MFVAVFVPSEWNLTTSFTVLILQDGPMGHVFMFSEQQICIRFCSNNERPIQKISKYTHMHARTHAHTQHTHTHNTHTTHARAHTGGTCAAGILFIFIYL